MYKNVKILNANEHGFFRYTPASDYFFAKDLPLIPISFSEIRLLCCDYPLVILEEGENLRLAVMTGVKQSSAVTEKGMWRTSYVPAFLRRYPFTLLQTEGSDELHIGFDIESGLFSSPEGSVLFNEDASPAPVLQQVTELLQAFQKETQITQNILQVLKERGLLKQGQLTIGTGENSRNIDGFLVIDKKKVLAQDETALLETLKNGWMELVELQQLSLHKGQTINI